MVDLNQQWQEVTIAVVLVMFMAVGLVHMLGVAFNLNKLKAWAKNEFYQAVASAIIAGGMITLKTSLDAAMNSIFGLPPSCTQYFIVPPSCCTEYTELWFIWASCFYSEMAKYLLSLEVSYYILNFALGFAFSVGVSYSPFQQGFNFAPLSGLMPATDFVSLVSTVVGGALVLAITQGFILKYIHNMILMFFPIGIALRAFPFTRSAGGALIALVIGLYYVYPGLVALQAMEGLASVQAAWLGTTEIGEWSATSAGPLILGLMNANVGYVALVHGILFPIINLTLTLSFIKELAAFLGGEIDIRALEKLI